MSMDKKQILDSKPKIVKFLKELSVLCKEAGIYIDSGEDICLLLNGPEEYMETTIFTGMSIAWDDDLDRYVGYIFDYTDQNQIEF